MSKIYNIVEAMVLYAIDNKLKTALIGGVVFMLLVYLFFQIGRTINYTFGYESRVESTICEMAKTGAIQKGPNWKKICD